MGRLVWFRKAILMAGFSISLSFSRTVPAVDWTIIDLGTLGGTYSGSTSINDRGQVVGDSCLNGDVLCHAFFYDGTIMHDLSTLGGSWSLSYGVNVSGNVVGESETADYSSRAFLYDGTALHDLGSLAPTYSAAYGINASGFIVGWTNVLSTDYSGSEIITEHAFLHDGMAMRDLGTLGGSWSWANGINRLGQVVGASSLVPVNNPTGAPEGQHAFLYDNAGMHDLSTLGGPVSEAYAVNASGQVVGWSYVGQIGNVFHAFLYDGAMHDLSTLGGSFSEAHDVNDRGQVVGLSDTSGDVSYDVFFLTAICAISAIWPKSQRQDGNLLVA